MLDTILQFVVAAGLLTGSYFLIAGAQKFKYTNYGVGIVMITLGVLCMLCGGLLLCYALGDIITRTAPNCPECNSNIGSNGYNFCPWCGVELGA
ncbi:MAG: hypothetical protein IJZ68_08605 [Bacteroidaceae bacterium]|nr:hypothetical protein [Bacteroidaceae bacterium]